MCTLTLLQQCSLVLSTQRPHRAPPAVYCQPLAQSSQRSMPLRTRAFHAARYVQSPRSTCINHMQMRAATHLAGTAAVSAQAAQSTAQHAAALPAQTTTAQRQFRPIWSVQPLVAANLAKATTPLPTSQKYSVMEAQHAPKVCHSPASPPNLILMYLANRHGMQSATLLCHCSITSIPQLMTA
jgi:hypothetical protein